MIKNIFPFNLFNKKEVKSKNPALDTHVNADFVVQRFADSSNSAAIKEVGEILAKNFKDIRMHGFGTEVSGTLGSVENALTQIAKNSVTNGVREQVELRIDFNPKKNRTIAQRLAV